MIAPSTIQLLRFPFSYFLMPVYWFALSFCSSIHVVQAILIFIILHLLLYPSSNGYNSYMDRDDTPIGGLAKPMQPSYQLFVVTFIMDAVAIAMSFIISPLFAAGIIVYTCFSRLYSYRGVRLKQYPIAGYITVIINQGALVFFIVWLGAEAGLSNAIPWIGISAATFLIGGFYPITQVYQHEADKKDNVTTISMLLGKKGTFVFCGLMYIIAFSLLYVHFLQHNQVSFFLLMNVFFLPVIVYFLWWMVRVWQDNAAADFKTTMRMNWLASTCTSLAFITIIFLQNRG